MNQLTRATLLGTIAQIAMVVAGHFVPAVANLFAIGGISAAIGIAVSVALGDVPTSLLALGTGSSAVTGLIGGLIGRRRV